MICYNIGSVDYLTDENAFKKGYDHVPDYRKVKIDALIRPEDKRLSLGAELLLEKTLCETGFSELAEHRKVYYTKQGKPYILHPDQGIDEPPPVHISISHSQNHVMCVVSDTVIGCDIEYADIEKTDCLSLASRFFSDEECRVVESDTSAFFRLWTQKEAYCKCTETPLPLVLKMNLANVVNCNPAVGKERLVSETGVFNDYFWTVVYRG